MPSSQVEGPGQTERRKKFRGIFSNTGTDRAIQHQGRGDRPANTGTDESHRIPFKKCQTVNFADQFDVITNLATTGEAIMKLILPGAEPGITNVDVGCAKVTEVF